MQLSPTQSLHSASTYHFTPSTQETYPLLTGFFEKTHSLNFLKVAVVCNAFPAILTFAAIPETWVNALLTFLACGMSIFALRSSHRLSHSSVHYAIWFFLLLCHIANTLFAIRYESTRTLSSFALIVYPTLYAPKISFTIPSVSIVLILCVAGVGGTFIQPPIQSNLVNSTPIFIEIFSYCLGHFFLASFSLKQLDPLTTAINSNFRQLTSRIDSILLHLFPPQIAYSLSKTPIDSSQGAFSIFESKRNTTSFDEEIFPVIESETSTLSFAPRFFQFSRQKKVKHVLAPNILSSLSDFCHIHKEMFDPRIVRNFEPNNHPNASYKHVFVLNEPPPSLKLLRFLRRKFRIFNSFSKSKVILRLDKAVTIFLSMDPPPNQIITIKHLPFIRAILNRWDILILNFEQSRADKIKVFETCRMFVSLPECSDTTVAINLAVRLIDSFHDIKKQFESPLQLSIGMSFGCITAGVWGKTLFQYDIVGAPVNLAARLCFAKSSHLAKPEHTAGLFEPEPSVSLTFSDPTSPDPSTDSFTRENSQIPIGQLQNPKTFSFCVSDEFYQKIASQSDIHASQLVLSLKGIGKSVKTWEITVNIHDINDSIDTIVLHEGDEQDDFSYLTEDDDMDLENSDSFEFSLKPNHIPTLSPLSQNQPSRTPESISYQTNLNESHGILRNPHNRDSNVIRSYIILFLLIMTALLIASFVRVTTDISVLLLSSFLLILVCLLLFYLFYLNRKVKQCLSKPRAQQKNLFKLLESHSNAHYKTFFYLSFFSILFGTIAFGSMGDQYQNGPPTILLLLYNSLIIVDRKQFERQSWMIYSLGTFSYLKLILLGAFYHTDSIDTEAPIFGLINNRDLNTIFLSLNAVLALGSSIHQVNRASQSTAQLYENSLHPNLRLIFKRQPINSKLVDAFDEQYAKASHGLVAIGYLDITNFTSFCNNHSSEDIIRLMDSTMSQFDYLAKKLHLIKASTVGDAYILLSNEPDQKLSKNQMAKNIRVLILFCESAIQIFNQIVNYDPVFSASQPHLGLRAGITVAPCSAALVGRLRPSFQYFGQAIDRSCYLQSNAASNTTLLDTNVFEYVDQSYISLFPSFESNIPSNSL